VLQVDLPAVTQADAALVECYVRGGDLVATYAERPTPQMRAQIYWRVHSHSAEKSLTALELVASVQTSLLDDDPAVSCSSVLPACEVLRLGFEDSDWFSINARKRSPTLMGAGPMCLLFRLAGGISYAEMVHPAEYEQNSAILRLDDADGSPQIFLQHQLFLRRLEKGVILRSRLLGLFLPTQGDEQAVAAAYRDYCSSEPPLTT
jgi:hypothetical protein